MVRLHIWDGYQLEPARPISSITQVAEPFVSVDIARRAADLIAQLEKLHRNVGTDEAVGPNDEDRGATGQN